MVRDCLSVKAIDFHKGIQFLLKGSIGVHNKSLLLCLALSQEDVFGFCVASSFLLKLGNVPFLLGFCDCSRFNGLLCRSCDRTLSLSILLSCDSVLLGFLGVAIYDSRYSDL